MPQNTLWIVSYRSRSLHTQSNMIDLKDFQQKKSLKAVKIGDAYMVHILTIYKADTLQQVKNACRANNVGIREDLSTDNEIYAE